MTAHRNQKALLVVEDDVLIADMLVEQLAELGYQVAGKAHSLEAGKLMSIGAQVHGALIDVNLGHGALSSPIADILVERKIPFLFVSGYREVPEVRFRRVPVLQKPFSLEGLRLAVEQMLARDPFAGGDKSIAADHGASTPKPRE
jgi:CheY-like chemotaxis protein